MAGIETGSGHGSGFTSPLTSRWRPAVDSGDNRLTRMIRSSLAAGPPCSKARVPTVDSCLVGSVSSVVSSGVVNGYQGGMFSTI